MLKAGLVSRSRLIWSQSTAARRRGYFLAGVGLTTGHALDAIANLLLIQANGAILAGDAEAAIGAITGLAEQVFTFYPFTSDPLPANWRHILRAWLLGQPLAAFGRAQPSETLQFVEGGIVYRLVVAAAFVAPATIAGFHATHGILNHLMPSDAWQITSPSPSGGSGQQWTWSVSYSAWCAAVP